MRIRKILKYLEVIILVGIILTPAIFFSIIFALDMGPPRVDFREGDIIQLNITRFSFDHNITNLNNYTVTAGIYMNPILYFEEGKEYDVWEKNFAYDDFILFEGNSASGLLFSFHVDSINKKKTIANLTLDSNNRSFSVGLFEGAQIAPPFFEPSLAVGLTFRSLIYNTTYIHWRVYFVFSTSTTRADLNYHCNHYATGYGWAKEYRNVFSAVWQLGSALAYATYRLRIGEDRLQEVDARFLGVECFNNPGLAFSSNMSAYSELPGYSHWDYYFSYELKYFRGVVEI
ncbi:MAG: hypothetical protein HeimAB125_18280 [Candidatus Heimdallarchaeota archaeon AB_125]|nr:MAG: hypothetical protein HeimAB125_18280 [Candidatus Heimdallarchaeota archaeon AB_125]